MIFLIIKQLVFKHCGCDELNPELIDKVICPGFTGLSK